MSDVQGWAFLVARGTRKGHRAVLAPDFLVRNQRHALLTERVGGTASGTATSVEHITDDRYGDLTVTYRVEPVLASELTGGPASQGWDVLLDQHGRPLEMLYGLVTTEPVSAGGDDVAQARAEAVDSYRRFLADEDSAEVQPSAAFPLQEAVPVPASPTTAPTTRTTAPPLTVASRPLPAQHDGQPPRRSGAPGPQPRSAALGATPPQSPVPVPVPVPQARTAVKRRATWPWVLLAVVIVPILGFAAYTATLGAGDTRTARIGETVTDRSGLALTVSAAKSSNEGDESVVGRGQDGYEVVVTVTNRTKSPINGSLISIDAAVNGTPAQALHHDNAFRTQQLPTGQSLVIPYRFQVPSGTNGRLQVTVSNSVNEPVFFIGSL